MSTSTLPIDTRFFVTVFPATAGDRWVSSFEERRWENDATRKTADE